MSAVPRDPMFWKRFSAAVHKQESEKSGVMPEKQLDFQLESNGQTKSYSQRPKQFPLDSSLSSSSSSFSAPIPSSKVIYEDEEAATSQDWLQHKQSVWRRQRWGLCFVALGFLLVIVLTAVLLIWLSRHQFFANGQPVVFP